MNADFTSAGTLCVVGRLYRGDQSRGVALALDIAGDLNIAIIFSETKFTELTGVSPLLHSQ
jgi:hypothetical protein